MLGGVIVIFDGGKREESGLVDMFFLLDATIE
jgi:hypothetical protein